MARPRGAQSRATEVVRLLREAYPDATCALHHPVDDEALYHAVPLDLDKPFVVCRRDCRIEPKLLLVHLEKAEDDGYKLQSIFVDVELFGCDPA